MYQFILRYITYQWSLGFQAPLVPEIFMQIFIVFLNHLLSFILKNSFLELGILVITTHCIKNITQNTALWRQNNPCLLKANVSIEDEPQFRELKKQRLFSAHFYNKSVVNLGNPRTINEVVLYHFP